MKLNTFLLLAAINWILFGLGGLFVPQSTFSSIAGDGVTNALLQHVASSALVLGLLAWFARKLTDPDARRLIITIFIIAFAVSAIINGMGIINGIFPSFDWIFVGIDLIFAFGFAYFRFIKSE